MITADRIRDLFLDAAPRPKIAAGIIALVAVRVAAHLGVDFELLGIEPEAVEVLIVFGVMYLKRDALALPMSAALEAKRPGPAAGPAQRAAFEETSLGEHPADPPDLSPVPREAPPE